VARGAGTKATRGRRRRNWPARRADPLLLDALGSFFKLRRATAHRLGPATRRPLSRQTMHIVSFSTGRPARFLGQSAPRKPTTTRVFALRPADFEAKNRSDLRTQTCRPANHIAELERVVARGFAEWRGEVQSAMRSTRIRGSQRLSEIVRAPAGRGEEAPGNLPTTWAQRRVDGGLIRRGLSARKHAAGTRHRLHTHQYQVGLPRSETTWWIGSARLRSRSDRRASEDSRSL